MFNPYGVYRIVPTQSAANRNVYGYNNASPDGWLPGEWQANIKPTVRSVQMVCRDGVRRSVRVRAKYDHRSHAAAWLFARTGQRIDHAFVL